MREDIKVNDRNAVDAVSGTVQAIPRSDPVIFRIQV
jgi:hypothetical protein